MVHIGSDEKPTSKWNKDLTCKKMLCIGLINIKAERFALFYPLSGYGKSWNLDTSWIVGFSILFTLMQ